MKRQPVPDLVRGTARRALPRPQPPMADRRTKRARTRSAQERRAIQEGVE